MPACIPDVDAPIAVPLRSLIYGSLTARRLLQPQQEFHIAFSAGNRAGHSALLHQTAGEGAGADMGQGFFPRQVLAHDAAFSQIARPDFKLRLDQADQIAPSMSNRGGQEPAGSRVREIKDRSATTMSKGWGKSEGCERAGIDAFAQMHARVGGESPGPFDHARHQWHGRTRLRAAAGIR